MPRPQSPTLDVETIHTLLSSGTRRAVLESLRTVDRTTPKELSRQIASSEHNYRTADAGSTTRRSVSIALVHNHLPRLDAHDVVDYRHQDGVVMPGANFDDLESFLERLEHRE
ncbi:hypothetical protein BDK88_1778 [Natrinema hispanicum]|uniref:DUF7344 domain-containing protein n=1 Tax=Natrinema hispanicum TaxID=392421 RepID=A0A482YB53_9EURY|nr:hypothetical protein [Natrinema hispanicum]RZV10608.1 hypothetical protein BDK88_1778 [Natrinema hispanicum]